MILERKLCCCNCNQEFVAKGEGDTCDCPYCGTELYFELERVCHCWKTNKDFVVSGEGYKVRCPYCNGTHVLDLEEARAANIEYYHGSNRRRSSSSSSRETDYYDADMEGAPGYYGDC